MLAQLSPNPPMSPMSPKQPTPGGVCPWGLETLHWDVPCVHEGMGKSGGGLGGGCEGEHTSPPRRALTIGAISHALSLFTPPDPPPNLQRAVEVMCIVPKRCNDMMNVGRLQGFDVMRLLFKVTPLASVTFSGLGLFIFPVES